MKGFEVLGCHSPGIRGVADCGGGTARVLVTPGPAIKGRKGGENHTMETNGNGTNAKVPSGRGLVHRHLDKRQLACVAANVIKGSTDIEWSVAQLMAALKVNRQYIDVACTLSPEKRAAIIDGRDQTSFVTLLKTVNGNGKDDDAVIVALVRKYGPARVFDACCTVEAAQ